MQIDLFVKKIIIVHTKMAHFLNVQQLHDNAIFVARS